MASITIQQLFYDAYAYAGLIQTEQTQLNDDQVAECQQIYNGMIDSFQLDGRMISHVARLLFPITPSKGIYSVGPGGDWDPQNGVSDAGPVGQIPTNYPVRIQQASAVVTTNQNGGGGPPEYPMQQLSLQDYQLWVLKQQSSNWPWCYYYEPAFNMGLALIYLLYIPTDSNFVALYLEETLAQIQATQDAILSFRPGYYEMITSNMAKRIAMRYPDRAKISPMTLELARETLSSVRQANYRPLSRNNDMARMDERGNSYPSILSGNRY